MSYLIETLKNSLIGPVVNLTDPIDSDYAFPSSPNSINARYGLKNSFGFGGKSAAIVLETYNEKL
jgi:3-oxoacyl-(acyl-carrier-protein) synthase